jgi:hypothetical protein
MYRLRPGRRSPIAVQVARQTASGVVGKEPVVQDDDVFWFGKHQGRRIADTPTGYLHWVFDNCTDLYPDFREMIRQELARRAGDHAQGASDRATAGTSLTDPVISEFFRLLSLKYHPDRGGTHEQMLVVNEARELRELLRQLLAARR